MGRKTNGLTSTLFGKIKRDDSQGTRGTRSNTARTAEEGTMSPGVLVQHNHSPPLASRLGVNVGQASKQQQSLSSPLIPTQSLQFSGSSLDLLKQQVNKSSSLSSQKEKLRNLIVNTNNLDGSSANNANNDQQPKLGSPHSFANPSSNLFQDATSREKMSPRVTVKVGWQSKWFNNAADKNSQVVYASDLELLSKLPVTYSSIVERIGSKWVPSMMKTNSAMFMLVMKSSHILVYRVSDMENIDNELPVRILNLIRGKATKSEKVENGFDLSLDDGSRLTFACSDGVEVNTWIALIDHASESACVNDFVPIANLAHGHFGRVFLVRHKASNTPMAMKEIPVRVDKPEKQFEERSIISRLSSCNFVARLLYSFREGGNLCYVTELGAAGDLWSVLRRFKKLTEAGALFIASEMVVAIEAFHSQGIIHRDIKLENILIDHHGHIKVVDFGLSRILKPATRLGSGSTSGSDAKNESQLVREASSGTPPASAYARTFSVCGTNYYMPAEMLKGEGHSLTIDWWQLGCLIHELLTGVPTYYAKGAKKIHARVLEGPPAIPLDGPISANARDVILSFLDPNPSTRLGHLGSASVKAHPFFASIKDWTAVAEKRMNPPEDIMKHLNACIQPGDTLADSVARSFPDSQVVTDFERRDSVLGAGGGQGGKTEESTTAAAAATTTADEDTRTGGSSVIRNAFGFLKGNQTSRAERKAEKIRSETSRIGGSNRRGSLIFTSGLTTKYREPYIGFEYVCDPTLLEITKLECQDIAIWNSTKNLDHATASSVTTPPTSPTIIKKQT